MTDSVLGDRLRRFSRGAAMGVSLAGLAVLLGWSLDIGMLKSIRPGLATMKPLTALALLLSSLAVRMESNPRPSRWVRRASLVSAVLVALLGLLTLVEYGWSVDLGIDQLLFGTALAADAEPSPGRMAPVTAAGLLALGLALGIPRSRAPSARRVSDACALTVAGLGLLALLGHAYGVESLHRVGGYSSMAVHTALSLLLLGLALLAAHPEDGAAAVVASDGPGGFAVRRLLPLAAALPAIGMLRLLGQRSGLYDTAFGVALMVVVILILYAALVFWNARSLDRLEAERRTADAAWREKSQTLQLVLDTISDGAVAADREGRFVVFNRAAEKLLGRGAAPVAPANWSDQYGVFLPDARTPFPAAELPLARALRGEEVTDEELVIRTVERPEPVWLNVTARPLRDPTGALQGGISLFRDITEGRRLEEARRRAHALEEANRAAQEASRLKSEFLASMSHELRTPLNAIIGFAELMHDGKVGPLVGDQKEFLGDILTSSRHLLQLINDVLDLAKVEAGKMEFRPQPLQVARLIAEVRDVLRTLASSKRIAVTVELAPDVGELTADPGKFKQVLYNYLSNALKFTPDGGRVSVRVTREGDDDVLLEVEDTGIGIPPEDTGRLFVEFQQLDASTGKRYAGTGLGLALTRRIVEAQGGTVGVRSRPGQGSTFHAVLPRQPRSLATRERERLPAESAGDQANVLIVDDDPKALKLAEASLRGVGYRAICRSDVEGGLEAVAREAPAAVILDWVMPGLGGLEFLQKLHATGRRPIVLVWTAHHLPPDETSRLLALAQGIVAKADGIDVLLDELKALLAPRPGVTHEA